MLRIAHGIFKLAYWFARITPWIQYRITIIALELNEHSQ